MYVPATRLPRRTHNRVMTAPLLMILASLLFATMGLFVKLASLHHSTGEIVLWRGLVGVVFIGAMSHWRGASLRTAVPGMHLWRAVVGVAALTLWFTAMVNLPLATAVTLNYTSSVWMAVFLVGGAMLLGADRVDARLVLTVVVGFVGVALVLQPTLERQQFLGALAGLASGVMSALAVLQVAALGRTGEPEYRIVFYFSGAATAAGAVMAALENQGWPPALFHSVQDAVVLLATGALATLGQMAMTRAYAIGRPLANASLQYLGIVFSFAYGVLLFDDPVTPVAIAGMGLIVAAGVAATFLRQRASAGTAQTNEA